MSDSAIDVYKEMAAGSAQVNAMSDFLQEKEDDMNTKKPYFEGVGYSLGYGLPVFSLENQDKYDYKNPVNYDYSTNVYKPSINKEELQKCEDPRDCPDVTIQTLLDYKELAKIINNGVVEPIGENSKIDQNTKVFIKEGNCSTLNQCTVGDYFMLNDGRIIVSNNASRSEKYDFTDAQIGKIVSMQEFLSKYTNESFNSK